MTLKRQSALSVGQGGPQAWREVERAFGELAIPLDDQTQALPFSATVTPAAERGEYVEVGALTGNVTVAAPTNPRKGLWLRFRFLQDGTGGRTVTWNAVFKHAWSDTGNTADLQSTIAFRYDGTNWIQQGAQSPYF